MNPVTGTPLVATAIGVSMILVFSLAVPLEGLAKLTKQFTLGVVAIVNLSLIRIKMREVAPPPGIFVCPFWVSVAGLIASVLLLALDIVLFS